MAIALARPRGASGMARLAVMLGAVAVAGFMAIRRIEPLRQRFFEGDLAIEIYGVRINAMGRIDMWQVTLDSYREAPFLGKGVGAIHELIEARFPGLGHPHNDYLRILHDYGSVGFLLFTAGLLAMIFLSWSAWQRADRAADRDAAGVHLAAFLGLLAFSAAMLTDNVVVYVWVMVPLGVMVGASLGFPADGMHPRSADPPDDRST
jgi:O-antigen ligase